MGTGPKYLLRKLRSVMALPGQAQTRLDQIVHLIASNMVADVCSVYLTRPGEVLELFASDGLRAEAVHQTRLRFGEGLVGQIAATALPVNLPDAQASPHFVYRPETGEEIFQSFMGVPILRNNRVIGVVVLQNKSRRTYDDADIEAMQTVAMVLAETVASNRLIDFEELHVGSFDRGLPPVLAGSTLAEGMALGTAVLHEPQVEIRDYISDNPQGEKQRLEQALGELQDSLLDLFRKPEISLSGEPRSVLETYQMFASDAGWAKRIEEAIEAGLSAEAAVKRVQVENQSRMSKVSDPYIKERIHDLDDLANRLIRTLTGQESTSARDDLPDETILVARNLGPADLLEYESGKVRGVILEEGTLTSHGAIVARALGIPMLGRVDGVLARVDPGDRLIVDGENGQIHISPAADTLQTFRNAIRARERLTEEYASLRDEPAITRDGVNFELFINAGLFVDLPHLKDSGAIGIGLFRTELQFMISAAMPKLQKQVELYEKVFEAAEGRPVYFRTLDIGGDKRVHFIPTSREENPVLGWRAIRIGLDRPALLRYQIRALLKAAGNRRLNIMFPLIADVGELRKAKQIVEGERKRREERNGTPMGDISIGIMFEVPALAWQMEELLGEVDFISIGSNDLMQFLFAFDRDNPQVASRYDLISPAPLRLIHQVVTACNRFGVAVSLCGELGGRPLEALALAAVGLRRFSVAPTSVGPIKMMLRSLNLGELEAYMTQMLAKNDQKIRSNLTLYARDHQIQL